MDDGRGPPRARAGRHTDAARDRMMSMTTTTTTTTTTRASAVVRVSASKVRVCVRFACARRARWGVDGARDASMVATTSGLRVSDGATTGGATTMRSWMYAAGVSRWRVVWMILVRARARARGGGVGVAWRARGGRVGGVSVRVCADKGAA